MGTGQYVFNASRFETMHNHIVQTNPQFPIENYFNDCTIREFSIKIQIYITLEKSDLNLN